MKYLQFALRVMCIVCLFAVSAAYADGRGEFDMARWESILDGVRTRAAEKKISKDVVNVALKDAAFIPSIVKSDRNQAEFKLTLDEYLGRTVSKTRIANGRKMKTVYPTLLSRVQNTYGLPPHVILAFWGMESNYGEFKARYRLVDAFLTLMYEGRREKFFGDQLLALLKYADDNSLPVRELGGSWAGAMGHFQFIPTTLAQYGVDGNGDGKIDIINNVSDAMFSAGNYLARLGWNPNERIVRRVVVPADFDISLMDGKTRKPLSEWAKMGVINPDGTPIPVVDMNAGLVGDIVAIMNARNNDTVPDYDPDADIAPQSAIVAYLTYPNFYRIKKWNASNFYAIAIAELADALK